ncbi:AmmeMemoRadiSam system radical SAM enzyme [Butyrivibrio sp. CB08]|uniref:AmmeMemoRadiSam system radical SAM enzyme n=1 Tax=Butyrivibrio sp. CB08 TaxID=2364879 RepID=UPI000EAA88EE|nr:AmmeMemoRadiSam system radical SAM enzyme [Butyrivibrio sp. CB08]RKM59270.1 AmmeMemoRadiSam system radical SAM enzyme [Butyrivibrio sp. CB08]
MPRCNVCHNACYLNDGDTGLCRARICDAGEIKCTNYGLVTSIALDPIEKKPLNLFFPGSNIVSVGSYGCNLRCPFCQNHEISYGFGQEYDMGYRYISPQDLADIAEQYKPHGNIGVAFTYNEPLVGYEYVIDASLQVHKKGMKTVLVSNGNVTKEIAEKVIPHIDAMNIDLKGFTDTYYTDFLKGNRQMVMDFIEMASEKCHVEVTTLIVPTHNDNPEEIAQIAEWIAGLNHGKGKESIALHVTRYFPRFHLTDIPAPTYEKMAELKAAASKYLDHVFVGN